MAEYIEREAIEKFIEDGLNTSDMAKRFGHDAIEIMAEVHYMPVADVTPVVHGKWETNSDRPDSLICSVCKCGFDMWKHDPHNYCPNCGAKMDATETGNKPDPSLLFASLEDIIDAAD